MPTQLGNYLNKLGVVKDHVRKLADVKKSRMNDLNNKSTAKPSPKEFYRIVYAAIKLAGLEDSEFVGAVEAIFPERPKNSLTKEFEHLPVEIRFLNKHVLKQGLVEDKIGMPENKISRLVNEKGKDLLAVELICFMEAMNYDVLDTFKEIYGKIELKSEVKENNENIGHN